ncbi:MAG: hypothetical protein LBB12_03240, partial [Holosporaceae bacterium]|nr:hypothetical protein [Holosporaceae bacterium]
MRKMTFGVRSVLFAVLAVMLFSASGDVLGESWESDVEKESEISETIKQDFLTEKSFGVINKNILENIFQKNLNSKNIYDNLYQFSDKCWKLIDNDSADLEKVAQELFTEEYAQQLLKDNDEEKYRKISELCKSLHTFADSFWPSRRDTKALEASVEKLNHKESSEITQKLRDNQVSREEEKSNISEPSSDTNIATVENKIDSSDHAEDKVKTSDAKKIQQDSIQLTSPAADNGEDTAAPGASASASPLTSPSANNGEETAAPVAS